MTVQDLQAPTLLLAMPQVNDPFFSRSIVLLAAHEDDGSLGFVVNRTTELSVREILEDLEIDWLGDPATPAFMGGPVQPHLGTLLFPSSAEISSPDSEGARAEVAPGVSMTQNLDLLTAVAVDPPPELRLLLGHAGWSPGQLMEEVSRHDWLIAPVDSQWIFAADPESAWEAALASMGIDPHTLPSRVLDHQQAN